MTFQGFLDTFKWVVFWFFLMYGLFSSGSRTFGSADFPWKDRVMPGFIFAVCMVILMLVVK